MNFPGKSEVLKDHEWVRVEGNHAIVGITDFGAKRVGRHRVCLKLKLKEKALKKKLFWNREAVKTVSDLFMPVSGKVIAVNADLTTKAGIRTKDPYQWRWMVKVEMTDPSQVNQLMKRGWLHEAGLVLVPDNSNHFEIICPPFVGNFYFNHLWNTKATRLNSPFGNG